MAKAQYAERTTEKARLAVEIRIKEIAK